MYYILIVLMCICGLATLAYTLLTSRKFVAEKLGRMQGIARLEEKLKRITDQMKVHFDQKQPTPPELQREHEKVSNQLHSLNDAQDFATFWRHALHGFTTLCFVLVLVLSFMRPSQKTEQKSGVNRVNQQEITAAVIEAMRSPEISRQFADRQSFMRPDDPIATNLLGQIADIASTNSSNFAFIEALRGPWQTWTNLTGGIFSAVHELYRRVAGVEVTHSNITARLSNLEKSTADLLSGSGKTSPESRPTYPDSTPIAIPGTIAPADPEIAALRQKADAHYDQQRAQASGGALAPSILPTHATPSVGGTHSSGGVSEERVRQIIREEQPAVVTAAVQAAMAPFNERFSSIERELGRGKRFTNTFGANIPAKNKKGKEFAASAGNIQTVVIVKLPGVEMGTEQVANIGKVVETVVGNVVNSDDGKKIIRGEKESPRNPNNLSLFTKALTVAAKKYASDGNKQEDTARKWIASLEWRAVEFTIQE